MVEACRTPNCTIADTGICLVGNDPASCEFRNRANGQHEEDVAAVDTEVVAPPVLEAPTDKPVLWGSLPLEVGELGELMASRPCLLVGILGTPAAGKTAALVSLYLRLSHGKLEGFQFADSKRLIALEEISQGARIWSNPPPDALTARTVASGRRVAGFLHIRMRKLQDNEFVDLLVPDLPGEWSDTLIDTNRAEGLAFLDAVHVIWVFMNGSDIRDNATRMHTLSRTKQLLRRVASMLGDGCPPVKIVVTHSDAGTLPDATLSRINRMIEDTGVSAEIVEIASFSSNNEVPAGSGIATLIEKSLPLQPLSGNEWPDEGEPQSGRFMLRYVGSVRQ